MKKIQDVIIILRSSYFLDGFLYGYFFKIDKKNGNIIAGGTVKNIV